MMSPYPFTLGLSMLIIISPKEARDLVDRSNQCENVLSINDLSYVNFTDAQKSKIHNLLELQFQDVEQPSMMGAPKLENIDAIAVWAQVCESENAIIHCSGNGSRSVSAGLITMVEWGYGVDHASTMVKIMCPKAKPNLLMLHLYGNSDLIEAAVARFNLTKV